MVSVEQVMKEALSLPSAWRAGLAEKLYILIVAVMHCSREPGYWKERVREKPSDG
jgi:hypothetical protein